MKTIKLSAAIMAIALMMGNGAPTSDTEFLSIRENKTILAATDGVLELNVTGFRKDLAYKILRK
jgi:hypothetical protein